MADGPARRPFDAAAAEIVEAFRPAVVSFHFGLPEAPLLARVRATGARIFASATTLAEAQWLERRGVDAIIAQGLEAGGHRGSFLVDNAICLELGYAGLGTLALVPQVVRAVRVPVIAAGGIAGPSGVAAALALGACAAQVGTAYLLCPQATTGALHRQALVSAGAHHTVLTNLFSGRPARGIVNRLIRELGPIDAQLPEFPLPAGPLLPLRRAAEALGRDDFSPLWAGQNVQGCRALDAGLQTRWLAGG